MTTPRLRQTGLSLLVLAIGAATVLAQTPRSSSSSQRPTSSRGGAAKGALPDPELLDGSKQKPDKRSEYGMIGDFELPGDENARNNKVGGQQGQQGQQQQGGGGGAAGGAPQAGGSQGQESGAQGAQAQAQPPAGGQQAGSGNAVDSPDANAQAQGQQVAELTGEGQGGQQPGGEGRPQQVSIGDSAMRIEAQNVAGAVGTQPAGQTQQHEKGTGTGGKPPTGNNSNKGAERGRVMPAGL